VHACVHLHRCKNFQPMHLGRIRECAWSVRACGEYWGVCGVCVRDVCLVVHVCARACVRAYGRHCMSICFFLRSQHSLILHTRQSSNAITSISDAITLVPRTHARTTRDAEHTCTHARIRRRCVGWMFLGRLKSVIHMTLLPGSLGVDHASVGTKFVCRRCKLRLIW
jgi:hypothetical protein